MGSRKKQRPNLSPTENYPDPGYTPHATDTVNDWELKLFDRFMVRGPFDLIDIPNDGVFADRAEDLLARSSDDSAARVENIKRYMNAPGGWNLEHYAKELVFREQLLKIDRRILDDLRSGKTRLYRDDLIRLQQVFSRSYNTRSEPVIFYRDQLTKLVQGQIDEITLFRKKKRDLEVPEDASAEDIRDMILDLARSAKHILKEAQDLLPSKRYVPSLKEGKTPIDHIIEHADSIPALYDDLKNSGWSPFRPGWGEEQGMTVIGTYHEDAPGSYDFFCNVTNSEFSELDKELKQLQDRAKALSTVMWKRVKNKPTKTMIVELHERLRERLSAENRETFTLREACQIYYEIQIARGKRPRSKSAAKKMADPENMQRDLHRIADFVENGKRFYKIDSVYRLDPDPDARLHKQTLAVLQNAATTARKYPDYYANWSFPCACASCDGKKYKVEDALRMFPEEKERADDVEQDPR